MEEILIQCFGVRKSFHPGKAEVSVLRGVDVSVSKTEWVAVRGASGSGKTTLLNILGTLEDPDEGKVVFNGVDYASMSRGAKAAFRNSELGFVFQAYHMLPELSVVENVRLPAMMAGAIAKTATRDALELLERVGLKERSHHMPSELSGGERQRAAIARALINSPDLLLADEPTGNLDSEAGTQILEIFSDLRRKNITKSIIMITHDKDVAARADRTILLEDGRIEHAV